MAKDQHIHQYSAADLQRYQQGEMSAVEMHQLEKAALEDPLLADALEGYRADLPSLSNDLSDLRHRLQKRTDQTQGSKLVPLITPERRSFTWLRVAAMVVVVAGAAFLAYQYGFKKGTDNIALNESGSAPPAMPAGKSKTGLADTIPADVNTMASTSRANDDKSGPSGTQPAGEAAAGGSGPLLQNVTPGTKTEPHTEAKENEQLAASAAPPAGGQEAAVTNQPVHDSNNYDGAIVSSGQYNSNEQRVTGFRNSSANANFFRGRVTDESNNALPFAKITNTRDSIGTYSDVEGNFVLVSPDTTLDVRVRSLGFESREIELQNGQVVRENQVVMQEAKDNGSAIVINQQAITADRNTRGNTRILEQAEPVDGWRNYDRYVANNLNVPESYRVRPAASGEVELTFEVNKNGEPVNITVTRSLCESCDREAIRVLKDGPKWKSNTKAGRTSVTITF